jgi:TRAP-type C4-dicarboxylate transport system permease small subunit
MTARPEALKPAWQRAAEIAMAACLAVMAAAVFLNVVLRYGFGSGIAASEELSRLLFVWMVFIGATAAYPLGEHMAFTSLLPLLQRTFGDRALGALVRLIHALVTMTCGLVGWGAWQQVMVGLGSSSVVLGYNAALLPLPAFLSAVVIGVVAAVDTIKGTPIELGHEVDVE